MLENVFGRGARLVPSPVRCALAAAAFAVGVSPLPPREAGAVDTSDLVSDEYFRVCADPANMPFSNEAGEGFENELAELFAEKLGREVRYEWFPQATGFIRNTLKAAKCDVVMGYAQGHELVLNTNHYYVSAYVLVARADGPLAGVERLADPALEGKRLGVVAGSPVASHAARYGLMGSAKPYPLMVDRRYDDPTREMIDDIVSGETDAALAWGPLVGWYAKNADADLVVTPLLDEQGPPRLFYRITLGVRQGELSWKRELNSVIRRNQDAIDAILTEYGVPLVEEFGRSEATTQ
ncbi:MAG: substrate-binding domain-containing protein [Paracoccaceae bacterium]